MKIRRTLGNIVTAGALALSLTSCLEHQQYIYDGKIGEDKVQFLIEGGFYSKNKLIVSKSDGRTISYIDSEEDDLKLECILITKDGQTKYYSFNNDVGKPIMEEAQKQFDLYLQKIKKIKISEGLENLK